jgi:hypothetical protein
MLDCCARHREDSVCLLEILLLVLNFGEHKVGSRSHSTCHHMVAYGPNMVHRVRCLKLAMSLGNMNSPRCS